MEQRLSRFDFRSASSGLRLAERSRCSSPPSSRAWQRSQPSLPSPYPVAGHVLFRKPSANAGALSVRPKLMGAASGLSGALGVAGGALMMSVTGAVLTETDARPAADTTTDDPIPRLAAICWLRRLPNTA